jgi:hypothetical protein
VSKTFQPFKRAEQPLITLPRITVPCSHREFSDAFQLGVHHGFTKSKKRANFIVQGAKTAYALGVLAGTAARQVQRESVL